MFLDSFGVFWGNFGWFWTIFENFYQFLSFFAQNDPKKLKNVKIIVFVIFLCFWWFLVFFGCFLVFLVIFRCFLVFYGVFWCFRWFWAIFRVFLCFLMTPKSGLKTHKSNYLHKHNVFCLKKIQLSLKNSEIQIPIGFRVIKVFVIFVISRGESKTITR